MRRTIWAGIFILTFLKLNAQSVFLNGYSFVDGPRELLPEPTSITVMGDFFFQGYEELKESIYDSLFSSYSFEYAGDEIFGIGGFILDYTYIDQNLRLTIPGGVGIRTTILTPMTPYQWVNYACVLDVEKQTISLYIDGELIAEKPYETDDGDWEADNRVTIGGSDQRIGDGFNGKLSNFNVWGEALDQNEIQFFRHQSPTGLESNLMLSWDFSTIDNSTIRDRTSNMHHGMLQTGTSLRSDRPSYLLPIENIDLHLHRIEMVDFENLLIGHNPLTISLINYGKNQVSDFQASFYLNDSLIATEQIDQVILPRSRFDYTFQTPLHVDTGDFHLDIEITGLRADFLGNSSLQSEFSIKHQQIFPDEGAVYGKHEVTRFSWESDLDPTFQNRLQVATDSLYENLILDTVIVHYKEYLIEDNYGPPDSLEVRLPIFDGQLDLMTLLEENTEYHWRLISSNDSTQYELESHFFTDSTRIVVFKDEIGDTFEVGEYPFWGKEAKVSFEIRELGIVRDINIGYTINQYFRCTSGDGFNGFISLISPSGTKIRLSKNHELFSISNTRYYDDEGFVSDTTYYDLFNDMGLPDHYNACIYNPLPRYPNFRLKPFEPLSTLIGEESFGTWTLTVDMDKLDGSISNVSLEIGIESHPIEVFVSKNASIQQIWNGTPTRFIKHSIFKEVSNSVILRRFIKLTKLLSRTPR
ncbi:MAG: LamG-like jellyroll fold domain-containing protein [Cytophagales bacterium]|nr:LamG-like jellyroll fold domain-containing protein [Cytophagales bacterium]